MQTQVCSLCGEEKPIDRFAKHGSFKNGRNSRCKDCKNKEAKKYYQDHKDEMLLRNRNKRSWRGTKYGLSKDGYDKLLEAQNSCCAICGKHESAMRYMVIDHCHTKNKVRGLLCSQCNICIGMAKENPSVLRQAANYLEVHHGNQT